MPRGAVAGPPLTLGSASCSSPRRAPSPRSLQVVGAGGVHAAAAMGQQERWKWCATMTGIWMLAMLALGLFIGHVALPLWSVGAADAAPLGDDCAAGGSQGACRMAGGQGQDDAYSWLAQERAARGANIIFTRDMLQQFDGRVAGRPLVLCVLGECFDVSEGEQFYGAGSHYSCFAGNDGSRAYVKGEFTKEACHDDVSDLSGPELIGVEHWLNFYKKHEHYRRLGVLMGRYYDAAGKETSHRVEVLERAAQQRMDELSLKILPGCNSKFVAATSDHGGTNQVWCSQDSGSVERHWTGLPRLEERLGEQGLFVYPNCAPDADRCDI